MRRQFLLLSMLVVTAGVYALTPPEQEKTGGEVVPDTESDSSDRVRQKSSAPAATFTPTEKIEADSAVSFPVDI
jgi:hypothetical protein